ncbi:Tetracycline resistance protein, class B [Mycobacteroides franklinii]|uniref:Tetracycline resistance protein, class B n=1 Tax=Mycobacteroides franklinii TaxID=948102 RepID=A0A4R8R274_9MYCO|nr:MFS transporter [Mycobacteroides franklinii]TDZ43087.1 Tetracycline resistance protein, class B [Mycobacteroides franklinii]TDZ50221.1 Tetracycline resistance protein, class B [Mycobacteroides franklinii]TDZ56642.1 Tetracycline resistance protein, class B [Mycobacteroides franklinii]TDZ63583.1 Tetracycline resistance protein, class B [Mycobacteroides franklinii]TDZ69980.1 Tetracycline resistance protein, class B [Mycobacteroides franklinii]
MSGCPDCNEDHAAVTPRLPWEIWVLVVASLVIALGFGVVAPALPQYARSFGVSVTAATAVVSSFAAFRLVFAPAAGALVQRLGERWVYMTGLLIVATSTGICAFVHSYWQLLVFRSLGGIGSTMFTVSAAALLVRIAPEQIRGRAQGLYGSSFLLGMVAGPAVGSAVVGLSLSAPFIIYSAALVIVAALVYFGLRRSTLLEVADVNVTPVTLTSALHHRTFLAALMSNFSAGWAIFGIRGALLPLLVVEVLHQRPGAAGLVFAAFAAGDVSTAFLAGSWSDDIGRKPLVVAGLLVCGSTVVAMGFVSSLPVLIVLSLIGGIGAGLYASPQQAAVADVVGSRGRAGTALATFQMTSDIGLVIGPVVAGVIAEQTSYGWAFVVGGAMPLIAAVAWVFAPETLGRLASPQVRSMQEVAEDVGGPER